MNQEIDAFSLQAPAEPFPAIETNLDVIRKPGSQAYVHESEFGVIKVEIQVLALHMVILQLWKTCLFAIYGPVRGASFQAGPGTDKAGLDALLPLPFMGKLLLTDSPGGDMDDALPTVVFGILLSGINYFFGLALHPVFVVFVEDAPGTAKTHGLGSGHERENESLEHRFSR